MAGWHHQLDGSEFEWTLGVGNGQGGLACCNSWGHKESDMTEWLNWTELIGRDTQNSQTKGWGWPVPKRRPSHSLCSPTGPRLGQEGLKLLLAMPWSSIQLGEKKKSCSAWSLGCLGFLFEQQCSTSAISIKLEITEEKLNKQKEKKRKKKKKPNTYTHVQSVMSLSISSYV